MSRAKTHLVTIFLFILHLAFLYWTRVLASEGYGGKPLVIPITRDWSTDLYTIPFKDDGRRLVLDLAGPLVWSTCDASHDTFQLHDRECLHANQYTLPRCWAPQQASQDSSYTFFSGNGKCAAHPYNPFSGKCAAGDLTRAQLSMNATNGMNPLHLVSFSVLASCAPGTLLASLPAGVVGVAGLSSSQLALPAQVVNVQKIPNKFALCLPGGSLGAVIFGGGPFFLMSRWGVPDMAPTMDTPLQVRNTDFSGRYHYYIKAKGVSVNQERVPLFGNDLSIALSPRDRYTALRSDVYRALLNAYDRAAPASASRVTTPVAPFGLCYDTRNMVFSRFGLVMPEIALMLDGGQNLRLDDNSLVGVSDHMVCLAFVEMKQVVDTDGPRPAIVLGGYQMEEKIFLFDLDKMQLGISSGLLWSSTSCGNFNFTMGV